jgi:hypothetical protein
MLKKIVGWGLVGVLLVTGSASLKASNKLLEPDEVAEINWPEGVVRARGYGVAPEGIQSEAQAAMLAREAALTVAQRRLLARIREIPISADQTVVSLQSEQREIINKIKQIVSGAEILEEEQIDEKAYKVIMEVDLYGPQGLAEVIFPHFDPVEEPPGSGAAKVGDRARGTTGVIINALNLELTPALAPRIYSLERELVYGLAVVDKQEAAKQGLIEYKTSLKEARASSRVGSNPLVISADKVSGYYDTDLILSTANTELLRAVNRANSDIFAQGKIVIVFD